jgi:hypothetical protein
MSIRNPLFSAMGGADGECSFTSFTLPESDDGTAESTGKAKGNPQARALSST